MKTFFFTFNNAERGWQFLSTNRKYRWTVCDLGLGKNFTCYAVASNDKDAKSLTEIYNEMNITQFGIGCIHKQIL